jgi:glucose-6-phosphate isomerase, archaeal
VGWQCLQVALEFGKAFQLIWPNGVPQAAQRGNVFFAREANPYFIAPEIAHTGKDTSTYATIPFVILDFNTGQFDNEPPQSRRTLRDLRDLFATPPEDNLDGVVYETFGCPSEVEGQPRLLYATTVLQAGNVNGEFFMTRGHFHLNPERGELMWTLRGTGSLILMDRDRNAWTQQMLPGSTHDIDGAHAHRVANTGDVPLVFLVAWMSDCGHDYGEILSNGFSGRLMQNSSDQPVLV